MKSLAALLMIFGIFLVIPEVTLDTPDPQVAESRPDPGPSEPAIVESTALPEPSDEVIEVASMSFDPEMGSDTPPQSSPNHPDVLPDAEKANVTAESVAPARNPHATGHAEADVIEVATPDIAAEPDTGLGETGDAEIAASEETDVLTPEIVDIAKSWTADIAALGAIDYFDPQVTKLAADWAAGIAGIAAVETSKPNITEIAEPADAANSPSETGVVAGRAVLASSLNMRSQPTSRSKIVGALANGELALPLGETQGGWVKVRASDGNAEGWVFGKYLAEGDA